MRILVPTKWKRRRKPPTHTQIDYKPFNKKRRSKRLECNKHTLIQTKHTRLAPAWAQNIERMPVPQPTSTTTCKHKSMSNGEVNQMSESFSWCKQRPYKCTHPAAHPHVQDSNPQHADKWNKNKSIHSSDVPCTQDIQWCLGTYPSTFSAKGSPTSEGGACNHCAR